MNIIENIHRIQSMMGVINEDTRKNAVNRMIDTMGLSGTIDFLGDYDPILDDIVTKDDKISYIRETVGDIADEFAGANGFSIHEVGAEPIVFYWSEEEEQIIEYYTPYKVDIDSYGGHEYQTHTFTFSVRYEDLKDDIFDEVFRQIIEIRQSLK
jgi:hypothetical protein